MGYCWGGIFALIYSALNNNDVRNVVLMAKWSKAIVDLDRMMD
jgi:dienelactone hydrolase